MSGRDLSRIKGTSGARTSRTVESHGLPVDPLSPLPRAQEPDESELIGEKTTTDVPMDIVGSAGVR